MAIIRLIGPLTSNRGDEGRGGEAAEERYRSGPQKRRVAVGG